MIDGDHASTHQPLLFQQVAGFLSFFAVLILKLLKPATFHFRQHQRTFPRHIFISLKQLMRPHPPLLHLLLHVDALFLQQLSLSKGPVDRLHGCLGTRRPLPLQTSLLGVVEAEHVALAHDDAISLKMQQEA